MCQEVGKLGEAYRVNGRAGVDLVFQSDILACKRSHIVSTEPSETSNYGKYLKLPSHLRVPASRLVPAHSLRIDTRRYNLPCP